MAYPVDEIDDFFYPILSSFLSGKIFHFATLSNTCALRRSFLEKAPTGQNHRDIQPLGYDWKNGIALITIHF
jgi:hypothetical protein